MRGCSRPTEARRRGMTLLELLIALVITAVISLTIAAVTTAIARGMESVNEGRSAMQRTVAAHTRLRTYIHPSRCFLDADTSRGFVIWLSDARANSRVNLSEMRVFWFDPTQPEGDLTVEWASFPEDWSDAAVAAADMELTGADDYFAAMATLRAQGHTGSAVLADQVESVAVEFDAPSLPEAERVRLVMTIDAGESEPSGILMAFGLTGHSMPD